MRRDLARAKPAFALLVRASWAIALTSLCAGCDRSPSTPDSDRAAMSAASPREPSQHESGDAPEEHHMPKGEPHAQETTHDADSPERVQVTPPHPAHSGTGSGGIDSPGSHGRDAGVSIPTVRPDPSPLAAEALGLARSEDPDDHDRLAGNLLDISWLERLDSPELTQVASPERLQLSLVLEGAAADAPAVIERLVADPLYAEPGHRQIAMISASVHVKEPGKALQQFWRSQINPEADELESTILALVRNQSRPAMDLLAESLASDSFDDNLVFWWFHGPMLERRQDVPLLMMAERLLRSGDLSEPRSSALVESLFDYRPTSWYVATEQPPKPPRREKLGESARVILRSIADDALKSGLIDEDRRARIESEIGLAEP